MYRTFYANMPWTSLPLLALFLFLAVFLAVVLRVFGWHRPDDYAQLAQLAVDEADSCTQPGAQP